MERRTKFLSLLGVGAAVAASSALTAGIMDSAEARNVQADVPGRTFKFVLDEGTRKARLARFTRDLAGIGVSRPIVGCNFLLVENSSNGLAYGAECILQDRTTINHAAMCNNDKLQTFALTTTYAPTADWIAAFTRENCGDGAFDSIPDENGNTAF